MILREKCVFWKLSSVNLFNESTRNYSRFRECLPGTDVASCQSKQKSVSFPIFKQKLSNFLSARKVLSVCRRFGSASTVIHANEAFLQGETEPVYVNYVAKARVFHNGYKYTLSSYNISPRLVLRDSTPSITTYRLEYVQRAGAKLSSLCFIMPSVSPSNYVNKQRFSFYVPCSETRSEALKRVRSIKNSEG